MKKDANIQNEHTMEDLDPKKNKKKYVYPIRDWKEYLGESFLIVFSVLLALFLTEHISKLHERENTKNLLKSIEAELNHNKKALLEIQDYNLMVLSKIDIETVSILTKVYENQDRIVKIEDEVAKVIFDRASRDPRQVRKTLILISDIYHGWVVDRVSGLLSQIDSAIEKIEKY